MPIVPSAGDSVRSALHRYAIHELLNKGALANAFRATDEEGRKVFLKAYTSPTTFKPWYDAYLRYAIELNRRLGADPVLAQQSVRATDVFSATFTHDGVPTRNPCIFQAYPFISGNRNLGDLISDGYRGRALTGDERLMVAAIFTAALARLHAARVIHCDLKPANVQMVRIGAGDALLFRPLLVDMDYSVLADKQAPWHGDATAGYVGTPGYFSPEHLRGDVPMAASDAFTAAIILWQLLAGRHPFLSALGDDAEPGAYRERVLAGRTDFVDGPPPFLDNVRAPKLARLTAQALSPGPAARPTVPELHAAVVAARRSSTKGSKSIGRKTDVRHSSLVTRHCREAARHCAEGAARLVLTGKGGSFSTGGRFALTQTTLRRIVGDDARYAGRTAQFIVERDGAGCWRVLPPPDAPKNPTYHNGAPLDGPTPLVPGDTLSIGPVKALCTISLALLESKFAT